MPINKAFGVADPQYDALRVQSNQAIWPDAGGASPVGAGGLENKIYVWHADGSTLDLFDPDSAGLNSALAAAATGDTVFIPACSISGAHTIPAGLEVIGIGREKTILTGAITTSGTCAISHLSVIYSASSAGEIVAITGPSAGILTLYDCNVQGNNANGTGYALKAIDNGTIIHRFCVVSAQTGGFDSNPFSSTGASHSDFVEISTGAIDVTSDLGETIGGLTIGADYAVEAFNGTWDRGLFYDPEYTYRVSNDGGATWQPYYYLGRDFNGVMNLYLPDWVASAEAVNTNYARIYFTATTTSIKIRVGEDGFWGDNGGTLSWRLWGSVVTGGSIIEGYASDIANIAGLTAEVPRFGDRSAYDALNYASRHTNDADTAGGIHHTIGTGATQAAAGNHSHTSAGDIVLTDTHILVGNASNVAADVALSNDATISNTGALTLANTGVVAGDYVRTNLTVDAKGRITAIANSVPGAVSCYGETIVAIGGVTYYLANVAAANTVRAYVNGIRQPVADVDSDSDEVTFSIAPALNDTLIFDYELSLV